MCHSLITRSMAHALYMRKMLRLTSNKLSNDRHISPQFIVHSLLVRRKILRLYFGGKRIV